MNNSVRIFLLAGLLFSPASWSLEQIQQPYPAPEPGKRLTPPVSDSPSINGAKVIGARPGSPVLFYLPVTGASPVTIDVANLPAGLTYNPKNRQITGTITQEGNYTVNIQARNKYGSSQSKLTIRIGDTICLTPPMGWNSWYSYSESVSHEGILNVAKLMVKTGLINHGWTYVNIDDCWQGKRGGEYNAIQGNSRFPDMKKLCDDIHSLGLKAGIYSTPWMGTYAGFIGGSAPNEQLDYSTYEVPADHSTRKQEHQIFGGYPGLHKQKVDKVGPVWLFDLDVKQWNAWGFDYVKVDWKPNDIPTTQRIFDNLKDGKRDMVLSLSNEAPFENAEGLSKLANLWRTTGDIQDTWTSIKNIGFSQEKWQQYSSPGHWNDPDILQIGKLGKPNQSNTVFKQTRLTADEQYTQMTLWCILSAPLLISCDLDNMDDFTRGLLMNDDVIAVNQDPAARPAKKVFHDGNFQVWTKELSDGSIVAGFFNTGEKSTFTLDLEHLGLATTSSYLVKDLWKRENIGTISTRLSIELNEHGATMLQFSNSNK